ncbi:Hypothetical protein NTJ_05556 [Nesidiocoris tenuis]|uniref:Uncharacterized protein n=1 Tax=Nesidiocoris tenuis TaxID=355587 RepID=A0ABN7AN69_9HEMI|nr:Hypothetical protein NTJ_05556 [Nesidiocoris tenuis]
MYFSKRQRDAVKSDGTKGDYSHVTWCLTVRVCPTVPDAPADDLCPSATCPRGLPDTQAKDIPPFRPFMSSVPSRVHLSESRLTQLFSPLRTYQKALRPFLSDRPADFFRKVFLPLRHFLSRLPWR